MGLQDEGQVGVWPIEQILSSFVGDFPADGAVSAELPHGSPHTAGAVARARSGESAGRADHHTCNRLLALCADAGVASLPFLSVRDVPPLTALLPPGHADADAAWWRATSHAVGDGDGDRTGRAWPVGVRGLYDGGGRAGCREGDGVHDELAAELTAALGGYGSPAEGRLPSLPSGSVTDVCCCTLLCC